MGVHEMGEGLLRQRRNLIAVCSLLWLMKYGGISFSKFSFVGFDLTFANPSALTNAVWIVYAYFLYRYYQYFTQEGIGALNAVFDANFNKYCEAEIERLISLHDPTLQNSKAYNYVQLRCFGWRYSWYDHSQGPSEPAVKLEVPITRWMLKSKILKAFMYSVFRNSVVTDYLLPFALALWILWYCGSNNWQGSFFRTFFPI